MSREFVTTFKNSNKNFKISFSKEEEAEAKVSKLTLSSDFTRSYEESFEDEDDMLIVNIDYGEKNENEKADQDNVNSPESLSRSSSVGSNYGKSRPKHGLRRFKSVEEVISRSPKQKKRLQKTVSDYQYRYNGGRRSEKASAKLTLSADFTRSYEESIEEDDDMLIVDIDYSKGHEFEDSFGMIENVLSASDNFGTVNHIRNENLRKYKSHEDVRYGSNKKKLERTVSGYEITFTNENAPGRKTRLSLSSDLTASGEEILDAIEPDHKEIEKLGFNNVEKNLFEDKREMFFTSTPQKTVSSKLKYKVSGDGLDNEKKIHEIESAEKDVNKRLQSEPSSTYSSSVERKHEKQTILSLAFKDASEVPAAALHVDVHQYDSSDQEKYGENLKNEDDRAEKMKPRKMKEISLLSRQEVDDEDYIPVINHRDVDNADDLEEKFRKIEQISQPSVYAAIKRETPKGDAAYAKLESDLPGLDNDEIGFIDLNDILIDDVITSEASDAHGSSGEKRDDGDGSLFLNRMKAYLYHEDLQQPALRQEEVLNRSGTIEDETKNDKDVVLKEVDENKEGETENIDNEEIFKKVDLKISNEISDDDNQEFTEIEAEGDVVVEEGDEKMMRKIEDVENEGILEEIDVEICNEISDDDYSEIKEIEPKDDIVVEEGDDKITRKIEEVEKEGIIEEIDVKICNDISDDDYSEIKDIEPKDDIVMEEGDDKITRKIEEVEKEGISKGIDTDMPLEDFADDDKRKGEEINSENDGDEKNIVDSTDGDGEVRREELEYSDCKDDKILADDAIGINEVSTDTDRSVKKYDTIVFLGHKNNYHEPTGTEERTDLTSTSSISGQKLKQDIQMEELETEDLNIVGEDANASTGTESVDLPCGKNETCLDVLKKEDGDLSTPIYTPDATDMTHRIEASDTEMKSIEHPSNEKFYKIIVMLEDHMEVSEQRMLIRPSRKFSRLRKTIRRLFSIRDKIETGSQAENKDHERKISDGNLVCVFPWPEPVDTGRHYADDISRSADSFKQNGRLENNNQGNGVGGGKSPISRAFRFTRSVHWPLKKTESKNGDDKDAQNKTIPNGHCVVDDNGEHSDENLQNEWNTGDKFSGLVIGNDFSEERNKDDETPSIVNKVYRLKLIRNGEKLCTETVRMFLQQERIGLD